MRVHDLINFARERHKIFELRAQGAPKPWTKDKILQTFRFTNMYRELDTVTIWIAKNWREPHKTNPHLWLAMTIARFLNYVPALDAIGFPSKWEGWSKKRIIEVLKERKAAGEQNFSGVYMVRSDPGCKIDYVVSVWDAMWKARENIEAVIFNKNLGTMTYGLRDIHNVLDSFRGMGSFMSAQVIADLKYAPGLSRAQDWWTWAASGPGSRRGLARVFERPFEKQASWREDEWLIRLQELHAAIRPHVRRYQMPQVHAQDLQGWLCEFDKYERTRLGEGRPRNLYPGI